jgi:Carboxypeptidase regulatory-like domain/TonB dependent receptor-like, beta-barrel
MRFLATTLCLLLIPVASFAQTANGTITGTITDPTGAAVAGAAVEITDTDTGVKANTVTTFTGAYTATALQPGAYTVAVTSPGFKKYTRTGLSLAAAQTLGIDATLEVGGTNESVTVSAEASLLKTETGDVAHNITIEQLQDLPVLGIGGANAGSSGVRNPFNSTVMIPGVVYNPNFTMIVNGAVGNTAAYRVEGLDNTNHTVSYALQENQPSADAIQEVAVQTSNYAPEFGQAGGGLFNITMKSGTNQYHGTGYEYFVNEDLNAAFPFTINAAGTKVRPRNRRNDFGGTFGGPVRIPKLYDGRNKTFFFFSYEEFRESSGFNPSDTLPTTAYQNGDFSAISPNGGANFNPNLGVPSAPIATDALGRPVFANEIYDPTSRTANSATPFSNNKIPVSMITPFAKGVQALLPSLTNGNYINNYTGFNLAQRVSTIPSLKVDQSLGAKGKLAFYWGNTGTDAQYSTPNGNADGLPDIISANRGTFIHALTERLNYDYSITPTMLLHLGAGYSRISFLDTSAYTNGGGAFNCASIQLVGCEAAFNFPTITTLVPTTSASTLGGMQQLGNATLHTHTYTERPSYNANNTWVHGNHTYKFGAEVWFQGNILAPPSGVSLTFGANATAEPVNLSTGGQQMGFQYASFLLGDASSVTQIAPQDNRMGKSQWGVFAQDSWKITRKLTVDYGLRWDYATAPREQYGRSANLGLTTPDPAAGGRLGAPIFEATCNCTFVKNYPYAYGPRLGFAYQVDSKTVIRGGWGFVYSFAPDINPSSSATLASTPSGVNSFFNVSTPGTVPQPTWPNFNPGQSPLPGQITGFTGLSLIDPHASRPPRQNEFSLGIQREISRDFVLEASYVGNRGVWWTGPLGYLNQVSPATFTALGLNPYNNPADAALLTKPISDPTVIARVGNIMPYAGYSTSNTLYNALRPFPQFSTITDLDSPTGNTWYDSLQVKGTKRMSHGLQVNGTFTWSKSLDNIREDFFNPASSEKSIQSTDQPFLFTTNILYQTPKFFSNKFLSYAARDWQIGAFLQYGSGLPLTPPAATLNTPGGIISSEMYRTGAPLYLKDLNCGCINPYSDQVLNPAAWANPTANTFGPGPSPSIIPAANGLYYTDFRQARRPQESMNFGRNFRIKEKYTLSIRAEFANIFNRTQIGNPITTNPAAKPTPNAAGQFTGGFGVINDVVGVGATPTFTSNGVVGQLYQQPRQGTIVARFIF